MLRFRYNIFKILKLQILEYLVLVYFFFLLNTSLNMSILFVWISNYVGVDGEGHRCFACLLTFPCWLILLCFVFDAMCSSHQCRSTFYWLMVDVMAPF
jgi:hypothetical protein